MPKPKSSTDSPEEEPGFEEAYADLEAVVLAMESDQLPLGELIESYEKGTRLYRICQKRLEEAQDRIEVIRQKANGELVAESFDADEPSEAKSSPKPAPKKKMSLRENGELF